MAMSKEKQIGIATKLVSKLCRDGFYGELHLKFERGNIVYMRQTLGVRVEDVENRLLSPTTPPTPASEEETSVPTAARDS
jgi:hypothetical protein